MATDTVYTAYPVQQWNPEVASVHGGNVAVIWSSGTTIDHADLAAVQSAARSAGVTITINSPPTAAPQFPLTQAEANLLYEPIGSSGAIASVNGQTGTVVLTAADVGADASGAAAAIPGAAWTASKALSATDKAVGDQRYPKAKEFYSPSVAYNDLADLQAWAAAGGTGTVINGSGTGWTTGTGWAAWVSSTGGPLNTTTLGEAETNIGNVNLAGAGSAGGPLKIIWNFYFQNAPTYVTAGQTYGWKDYAGNVWPASTTFSGQNIPNPTSAFVRQERDHYISTVTAQLLAAAGSPSGWPGPQPGMRFFAGGHAFNEVRFPQSTQWGLAQASTYDNTTVPGTSTSVVLSAAAPAAWGTFGICSAEVANTFHFRWAGLGTTHVANDTLLNVVWLTGAGSAIPASAPITFQSVGGFDPGNQAGTGGDFSSIHIPASSVTGDGGLSLQGYVPSAGYFPGSVHNAGSNWTGWSVNNDNLWWSWYWGILAREAARDCYLIRQAGVTERIYLKMPGTQIQDYLPSGITTFGSHLPSGSPILASVGGGSTSTANGTWGGLSYNQAWSQAVEGTHPDFILMHFGQYANNAVAQANISAATGGAIPTAGPMPFQDVRPDFDGADITLTGSTMRQGSLGLMFAERHGVRHGAICEPSSAANWATEFQMGGMVPIFDGTFLAIDGSPGSPEWSQFLALMSAFVGVGGDNLVKVSATHTATWSEVTVCTSGTFTVTLPAQVDNTWVEVYNAGSGTITVTPASGTMNPSSAATLQPNQGYRYRSDGTNTYATLSAVPPQVITSASSIRATTGAPTVLSTDQNGDFAIDMAAKVIYGPYNTGSGWPAGEVYGASATPDMFGWAGWSIDPTYASGTGQPTTAVMYFVRFRAFKTGTFSNIDYYVQTAGATLTAGDCLLAIYDTGQTNSSNLTLLGAQSADQSTAAASTGLKTAVLGSAASLVAGQDYLVAMYFCGTTTPVVKCFLTGAFMPPISGGNQNQRSLQYNLAATNTLPASIAITSTLNNVPNPMPAVVIR